MEKQVCKKAPAFLSVRDPLCREAVLGAREDEAGSYTRPGGARSGGFAAGTLRGSRPAGVPSGTQCAPASRFPAAMNLHGPAHEAPVYTWAHATQNSRISVGKQMLGYGEKRLCAAHAVSGRGSMLFALNTKPDGKGACTGTKAGRRLCPGCRSMKQKHLGAGQIPVS